MAVPKIRSSKSRVRKRRASNSKFHAPQLDNCPQCDYLGYQRHRACPECGHYKGKQVIMFLLVADNQQLMFCRHLEHTSSS